MQLHWTDVAAALAPRLALLLRGTPPPRAINHALALSLSRLHEVHEAVVVVHALDLRRARRPHVLLLLHQVLRRQHDLALGAAQLGRHERRARVAKRELAHVERLGRAAVEDRRQLRQLLRRRLHQEARARDAAALGGDEVAEAVVGRGADGAAVLERLEARERRVAANAVQHLVHRARQRRHRVRVAVVHHRVRAEVRDVLDVGRGAGGDDGGAQVLGPLHAEAADAARPAEHQHRLALHNLQVLRQPLPRRQAAQRHAGRLHEAEARGLLGDLPGLDDGVLGVRARRRVNLLLLALRVLLRHVEGRPRVRVHLVAHLQRLHARAHGLDHAGDVPARHDGQRLRPRLDGARRDLPVHRVDRRRVRLDQHVVGAHRRHLQRRVHLHDAGVAVLAVHDGHHRRRQLHLLRPTRTSCSGRGHFASVVLVVS
mmetsp:Transcript_13230/g.46282  ORF Transcript_13230/g.46282 Transcript_13230/m.46282 type:complete len:429 (-) Transcript_13230:44-1330(-)